MHGCRYFGENCYRVMLTQTVSNVGNIFEIISFPSPDFPVFGQLYPWEYPP
ncbi:hypothetical protein NIES39_F00490 [Arthrospira platensis NIES-39]|nr:hypothetical protein NIES39_F00490 [Arthrospira platensis NIES-39]